MIVYKLVTISLREYIFIATGRVVFILTYLQQKVVSTRKIHVILIVLIFYSTSYNFQSSGHLLGGFNFQDSNQHAVTSEDQFNNSFATRQTDPIANLAIPNEHRDLDFLDGIFRSEEKNNTLLSPSKGITHHRYPIKANNIISTIQIINAPGSIISGLDLLNTSIELVNSPNSLITNNRIFSLSNNSEISAISIINSSNTIIANNIIENAMSSDGDTFGIFVKNSLSVEIRNNTINNLSSEIKFSSKSVGILISNSTYSNVTDNRITNIYGVSASAIVIEKGGNNRIESNIIEDIGTLSSDLTESYGILLVFTSSNVIVNNNLQNISANSFKARSLAFGISLTRVTTTSVINNNIRVVEAIADRPDSFGIYLSSSETIEVKGNYIEQILTHSDIEDRAFSTGIYMSLSENLTITQNEISQIIGEGRASYGIYADNSNLLEVSLNLIYDLYSIFRYQNIAAAIIIRISNNTIISDNNVSEIESLTINNGNDLDIPSALGILADNIINLTITKNIIVNIKSSGNAMPTDSIGILASETQNTIIQSNFISDIYSKQFDSFAIGIISYASIGLKINDNKIKKIQSGSNSILMYQAYSAHVSISNNSIDISGDGREINGIYSLRNNNETLFNNTIISNHQIIGVPAILISFSNDFTIYNNNLNDIINNSIGIAVKSGNNGIILENQITNFLLWMQMTEDSISVSCDGNSVDNIIHGGCIIGEFHDLVKLNNEEYNNFITDSLETLNPSNDFPFENLKGYSGSYLIFLMILPVILAAATSVIVKRKDIKSIFTKIE